MESKRDTYLAPIADGRWNTNSLSGYISASVEAHPAEDRSSGDTRDTDTLFDFLPRGLLLNNLSAYKNRNEFQT